MDKYGYFKHLDLEKEIAIIIENEIFWLLTPKKFLSFLQNPQQRPSNPVQ